MAKQQPLTMKVDPAKVQEMQRGYELRLARQRDALDRMARLLEERTNDVAEHMRRANDACAVRDTDQFPLMVVSASTMPTDVAFDLGSSGIRVLPDVEISMPSLSEQETHRLLKLIPRDHDLYNEDDTPATILEGYIKHLQVEVEHQRGKQASLVFEYQEPVQRLKRWMRRQVPGWVAIRAESDSWVDSVITAVGKLRERASVLEQERDQARADARGMANRINAQSVVVDGSDDPPWMASATIDHATVPTVPGSDYPGDSETLDWGGAKDLPPGEVRPGPSF